MYGYDVNEIYWWDGVPVDARTGNEVDIDPDEWDDLEEWEDYDGDEENI